MIAVLLHILLAAFTPDSNGYVWDFYSEAIRLTHENGRLPTAEMDGCHRPVGADN